MRAHYGVAPDDEVAILVRPDGVVGITADGDITRRIGEYLPRLAVRPDRQRRSGPSIVTG